LAYELHRNPSPAYEFGHLNSNLEGLIMARGSKSKYTDKQKRQAEHIAEGYEKRGTPARTAKARAWATVNKETGGGKKGGSGRGKAVNKEPSRKGGRKGGAASAARPASERSRSAKKAAATRAQRSK
jgi:plasmid stabilization system protein ParE